MNNDKQSYLDFFRNVFLTWLSMSKKILNGKISHYYVAIFQFLGIRSIQESGVFKILVTYQSISLPDFLGSDRNSLPEVFLRKDLLKICSKFTGEHPCRSAILIFNIESTGLNWKLNRKVKKFLIWTGIIIYTMYITIFLQQ